jgi:hypothetical protein
VLAGGGDARTKLIADRLESSGVPVAAIAPVQPSLEDVFLDVVEEAG